VTAQAASLLGLFDAPRAGAASAAPDPRARERRSFEAAKAAVDADLLGFKRDVARQLAAQCDAAGGAREHDGVLERRATAPPTRCSDPRTCFLARGGRPARASVRSEKAASLPSPQPFIAFVSASAGGVRAGCGLEMHGRPASAGDTPVRSPVLTAP